MQQKQESKQACIKKSSPLSKLDPIFQDDLLLVGGRLRHAPILEYSKHPVILPKGIHVTNIIILYYHVISDHHGREYMLALLRRKYWIIQANSAVTSFIYFLVVSVAESGKRQFWNRKWQTCLKIV